MVYCNNKGTSTDAKVGQCSGKGVCVSVRKGRDKGATVCGRGVVVVYMSEAIRVQARL